MITLYKLSNTPMTGYSYELWSLPFLLCFSLTNSSCFLLKSSIMDCRVEKLQVNSFLILCKAPVRFNFLTLSNRKHMLLEALSNLVAVLQLWLCHTQWIFNVITLESFKTKSCLNTNLLFNSFLHCIFHFISSVCCNTGKVEKEAWKAKHQAQSYWYTQTSLFANH